MNILFICRYNRFRSKVAEAYFKKINKNKNIKVKSAGLIVGKPIDKKEKAVTKTFGIKIINPPRGISQKLLIWQNLIVIVADDVPKSILQKNAKNIIVFKIKDANSNNKKKIEFVVKEVIKKIKDLNKKMENKI